MSTSRWITPRRSLTKPLQMLRTSGVDMGTKKERLWTPKGHRAVDFNEAAILRRLRRGPLQAAVKEDGFRCHIGFVGPSQRIACTTREGIEIVALRPFYRELSAIWEDGPGGLPGLSKSLVLDAEVILRDMTFEEMSGHLRREQPLPAELHPQLQFVVFDVASVETMCGNGQPVLRTLSERQSILAMHLSGVRYATLPNGSSYLRRVYRELPVLVHSMAQIQEVYTATRLLGHEGLVLKDPELHYRNGKVSGWWKVKPGCGAEWAPGFEADGYVVAPVWGDEVKANAGKVVGFVVKTECGRVVRATGLTQAAIDEYTTNAKRNSQHYYEWPCRITGMEVTADGSVRHPHFAGFRDIGGYKA